MHRRSPTRSPRSADAALRFAADLEEEGLLAQSKGLVDDRGQSPGRCKDGGPASARAEDDLDLLEKDIFHKYSPAAKKRGLCCATVRLAWPLMLIVALIALLFLWNAGHDAQEDVGSFVRVKGHQFYKDCRPFYFAGFNTHDAVTAAMLNPTDYKVEGGKSGKEQIRDMFFQARKARLSVVRTWVHTNDPQFPFQVGPGLYNEMAFRALDFVVEEARRNGLKLVLSLIDNWKYYNGVDQFVDWSGTVPERTQDRPLDKAGDPTPMHDMDEETKNYEVARHALFYNDTSCKGLYKNHVHIVVNRRNTFNGRLYKDEPAIMAWELLNEPRCETWKVPECDQLFQSWVEEMSTFIKSIDPNHLVTIGSEGFFGHSSWNVYKNPQAWAGDMGQDFVNNHLAENIDFATIHVWPDTWQRSGENFELAWIQSHRDVAIQQLGKPLVVEEFGKKLPSHWHNMASIEELRDPIFKTTLSEVEKSILGGSAIAGSMFWRWTLPMFAGNGRGEYDVAIHDTTFRLIAEHAQFVSQWTNSRPPKDQCMSNCWVPNSAFFTKSCENLPEVCKAYWTVMNSNSFNSTARGVRAIQEATVTVGPRLINLQEIQVYTTKSACCRSGSGGHSNGCSWHTWFV